MVDGGGIENVKFLPPKKNIMARPRKVQDHPGSRCHPLNDVTQSFLHLHRRRPGSYEIGRVDFEGRDKFRRERADRFKDLLLISKSLFRLIILRFFSPSLIPRSREDFHTKKKETISLFYGRKILFSA